jgi:RNA polymerase sigma factor (TIGR02999 family)
MSTILSILNAIEQGEPNAAEELLPLVYTELRELAARKLARESPGNTLQPTALVHEAYIRVVKDDQGRGWDSRGHFFAAAAEAMRRILIEKARQRHSVRHGGGRQRLDLDNLQLLDEATPEAVLALNEALERLTEAEAVVGQVVKLRFFAGLSIQETAKTLNISSRTANRHWCFARAWLAILRCGKGTPSRRKRNSRRFSTGLARKSSPREPTVCPRRHLGTWGLPALPRLLKGTQPTS